MRKLYNEALGQNYCPFANNKKIWPAIIAGAATLGAAGLGMASQASANKKNQEFTEDTNKTNYQIWQEQLAAMRTQWEQQQGNFQKQREWSIQDRNYENWYNSPQQQKLRYQLAGFNPSLMMEGTNPVGSAQASLGTAPSPNAVPSSPNMVAPHVNPVDYSGFGQGISNAVNTYMATRQQDTDLAATRQRVQNETLRTVSDINKTHWESKRLQQEVTRIALDNAFNKDTYSDRRSAVEYQAKLLQANTDLASEQAKTQNIINKFKENEQRKLLRNLDAQYDQILSAVRSNNADAAYKAALEGITNAQKEGVNIDNATKEELAGIQVEKALIENDALYWNAQQSAKNFSEGGLVGKYMPGSDTNGKLHNYNASRGRRRLFKRDGKYQFGYRP